MFKVGVRPKGNIVAGIDLKFAFDKNRIRFHTETVASALNNDIYGGPLTSERAEELGFEDVDQSELYLEKSHQIYNYQ